MSDQIARFYRNVVVLDDDLPREIENAVFERCVFVGPGRLRFGPGTRLARFGGFALKPASETVDMAEQLNEALSLGVRENGDASRVYTLTGVDLVEVGLVDVGLMVDASVRSGLQRFAAARDVTLKGKGELPWCLSSPELPNPVTYRNVPDVLERLKEHQGRALVH